MKTSKCNLKEQPTEPLSDTPAVYPHCQREYPRKWILLASMLLQQLCSMPVSVSVWKAWCFWANLILPYQSAENTPFSFCATEVTPTKSSYSFKTRPLTQAVRKKDRNKSKVSCLEQMVTAVSDLGDQSLQAVRWQICTFMFCYHLCGQWHYRIHCSVTHKHKLSCIGCLKKG